MRTSIPLSSSADSRRHPTPHKPLQSSLPSLGTLWSMPSSPFSTPLSIVLHLSHRALTTRPFIPLLSSLQFLFKLPFSTHTISAPILRLPTNPKPTYLTDSFQIAQYIDSNRLPSLPTLFPPTHLPAISSFNQKAALLNSFMRARLLSSLQNDPVTAANLFAPRPLRNKFFTKPCMQVALWLLARKYRRQSAYATRDLARAVLHDIRAALARHQGNNLRYLCGGGLTYADIVIVESLYFDPRKHTKNAYLFRDDEFADGFPDILAWARAVRETHYPQFKQGVPSRASSY